MDQKHSNNGFTPVLFLLLALLVLSSSGVVQAQTFDWNQPSDIEVRTADLSAIDQQFMGDQRANVESLANRLGRRLTGTPDRDISTLQAILDADLVAQSDTLALQGMGVVLGDLLADTLNMRWVVYRDRAGRSRALQFREQELFLFPVTMISRRFESRSETSVRTIFDNARSRLEPQLPGANWRR